MSGTNFSGKALADQIYKEIAATISKLALKGITPHLAIVQVGHDEAAALYAGVKQKKAKKLGISTSYDIFSENIAPQDFAAHLAYLGQAKNVHAILVEAPLPAHLKPYLAIPKEKDVDGAALTSLADLFSGRENAAFAPCTAMAAMAIIKASEAKLDGLDAVIVGRSTVVGKPLALLLTAANATVTLCHSHTRDLSFYTSHADLLIAAIGKPQLITQEMVKEGATLIDIGTTQTSSGLMGDFHPLAYEKAKFYTPVPGGVGPVTTAILFSNVVKAAQQQTGITIEDLT